MSSWLWSGMAVRDSSGCTVAARNVTELAILRAAREQAEAHSFANISTNDGELSAV